ncbi:hypothetical protein KOM00_12465 [Geomonas sp. Red69]|uniref:Uncharacterized protein n=2 Tax=Geomonas diazotrophica TaxID=2843197 RepID=A0ABX8JLU8_9BACT|nr:hypothetical protein [Geomonas diazotrophica]QWV99338.1 hypothetical protein KP005_08705 [Geomonas nitrogeniifigens]
MRKSGCRMKKRVRCFADCKTSSVGAVMPGSGKPLYYCSLDDAECRYALPVGYDIVCRHPDCELFDTEHPARHPYR